MFFCQDTFKCYSRRKPSEYVRTVLFETEDASEPVYPAGLVPAFEHFFFHNREVEIVFGAFLAK